jgi:hypothetical protein
MRWTLRSNTEAALQMLMEANVEALPGAGRHERAGERLNRPRRLPRLQAGQRHLQWIV